MILNAILVMIGTLIIYFIPGFTWAVFFLWPLEGGTQNSDRFIQVMELIALSIGISIAIIPLFFFFTNVFLDVGSNLLSVIFVSFVPTIFGLTMILLKKNGSLSSMARRLELLLGKHI